MKISVVGLGLMGGSFALAIKDIYPSYNIIGFDTNISHQKEAIKLGIVDEIYTEFNSIKNSDVIVLAIPVNAILEMLKLLDDIGSNTTIIDFGSTKELIAKSTPSKIRENTILAHPMTGTEFTGPSSAFKDLYKNKSIVLCDIDDSGQKHKRVALDIFEALEMSIIHMSAAEHDLHAAFISHLPHAISFALANSVLKQEDYENIVALAAGGFKDMSRVAKSSPTMWSDIFKQNRVNLLKSLEIFSYELKSLQKLIKDENYKEISEWMKSANLLHNIL
jgi:prephenate dehydrogenase